MKVETTSLAQFDAIPRNDVRRQSYYGRWKRYDVISSPADSNFIAPEFKELTIPSVKDQKKPSDVRPPSVFTRYEGGCQSVGPDGRPGNEIYFFGVIDILTEYGVKKRVESFGKRLKYDKNSISAINPPDYGERFKKFLADIII